MKISKIILIAVLLIATSVNAQYQISGIVTDEDKSILMDATVTIEELNTGTVCDANGKYHFKDLKQGNYTLVFKHIGYKDYRHEVNLDKDIVVDIKLELLTYNIKPVEISATRASENTPGTHTNIEKKEIQDLNLGQDLPYILQYTPSVVSTSDAGAGIGYTGIRIRGTDITRINVTVNGIPLNDPESHGVYWVNMPDISSSVENIQIQRGVGTSTNGAAAFGSSINILTSAPKPNAYAIIDNSYGSFNTLKNNIEVGTGLINNKYFFNARLSKIQTDGYIDRASSDLKSFYISGGYISGKHMIKLTIFSGKEKTYQAWGGVPKDSLTTNRTYNPYTYENQTDNYQQDHYQLHYSFSPNKAWKLNTAIHYTKGRGYYEEFKDGENLSDYLLDDVIHGTDTITETDLIRRLWLDNDFYGVTYSAIYNTEKMNFTIGGAANQYIGDHFGNIIWAEYASNGDYKHEWYNNQGKKTDINVFLKASQLIMDKFNLYLDMQYRHINYSIDGTHKDLRDLTQTHQFDFFNPKAGIFYQINKKQNTYFSFAIANREPNRSNYRDADDGYQPKAEKLIDYEAGYQFKTDKWIVSANAFFMNYKNQLVLTGEINDVGAAVMTNVEKSYRAGIELVTEMKICDKMQLNINATYSQNKINDFTEYVDNWDTWSQESLSLGTTDIAFSPEIVAAGIISYQPIKGANISLINKYVSEQFIDNTSSEDRQLDAYFLNHLRLEYGFKTKMTSKISVNLLINNIFNVEYESNAWVYRYLTGGSEYAMHGYYPQAGRNYLIGLRLEF